jgi:hypothetical protein
VAALLALGVLTACSSKTRLTSGCTKDEDCGDPQSFRCKRDTGECLCRTNAACPEGEFCNVQGYCQARVGCYENRDCPPRFFCDSTSNICRQEGRCTSDLHCPFGELCDLSSMLCKPGCRMDGDCELRQVCLCAPPEGSDAGALETPCACDPADAGEAEHCPVGRCESNTCRDNSYCAYGEVCRPPETVGLKQCQGDYDPQKRPYCDNCIWSPGENDCGEGANFCLYSTYTGTTYCGVDCSDGQECANGYDCADVRVVYTNTLCTTTEDCATPEKRTDLPCTSDQDCPNHGLCAKDPGADAGTCYGKCIRQEGASQSFCACIVDDDCAQDQCDSETRTCSITRRTCDPQATTPCRKIRCVDFGEIGGCLIGRNCKPVEGLTCADMR